MSKFRSYYNIFNQFVKLLFLSARFGPSVIPVSIMSLSPEIDELSCFANDIKLDLISLTVTWVYDDTVSEHHLHLPGYNLCSKNRKSGVHGVWVLTLIILSSSRPCLTYIILS